MQDVHTPPHVRGKDNPHYAVLAQAGPRPTKAARAAAKAAFLQGNDPLQAMKMLSASGIKVTAAPRLAPGGTTRSGN